MYLCFHDTKVCIIVPTYLTNNCVAISISFKFEAPAGYVDCRLFELSIVDCRSAAGRLQSDEGRSVGRTDSCCCCCLLLLLPLLIGSRSLGHCFCLNCLSVCVSVCLDICLNGTGNFESCKEIVIILLEAPQLQPPRPSRRVGGCLFFLCFCKAFSLFSVGYFGCAFLIYYLLFVHLALFDLNYNFM